jgi:hypothetical protein
VCVGHWVCVCVCVYIGVVYEVAEFGSSFATRVIGSPEDVWSEERTLPVWPTRRPEQNFLLGENGAGACERWKRRVVLVPTAAAYQFEPWWSILGGERGGDQIHLVPPPPA